MIIKVEDLTDKFYKEFITILNSYKNIKNNPKVKIRDGFKQYKLCLVILTILEILSIIYYILSKNNISLIILVLFTISIFLALFILIKMNTILKTQIANKSESKFVINKEGINLIKNNSDLKLMWSNISYVIINKETITFLPCDDSIFICIPSKYKDEVIANMKKVNQDSKIVNNI